MSDTKKEVGDALREKLKGEQPGSYVCGKCGEEKVWVDEGYHTIDLCGGYSSTFPPDNPRVMFVVCDECLVKWVGSFAVKPRVVSYWDAEEELEGYWEKNSGDAGT